MQHQQEEQVSSHSAETAEEDRPIGAAPTLHIGNFPLDAVTVRWLAAFAAIGVSGDDTFGGGSVDSIVT